MRRTLVDTLRCLILCTVFAVAMSAGVAAAQPNPSPEAGVKNPKLDPIVALNQEAIAAFESYSFTKARKSLDRALDLAAGEGLLTSTPVAQTYMLLGVAHVAGTNDLYRGLHYFVKALRVDPKVQIPQKLTTPQLLKMFKTAQKTVKAVGKPETIALREEKPAQSAAGANKVSGRGLLHTAIDTVKRGYPIPIKAQVGMDIQANRLFLYYRPAGTVKFNAVPMKKAKGAFRASIPAGATTGRYIHYYIEALDQRGRLAASMGSARSPNVVIVN